MLIRSKVMQGIGVIIAVLFLATNGQAALFTTTNGQAVVTAGTNTITITLTDTAVNPTSIIENISGFVFSASTGSNMDPDGVNPSVGTTYVDVADGGGYAGPSTTPTFGPAEWLFYGTSSQYVLWWNAGSLGTGPDYTIIGIPGGSTYSNANGSIAGNGPHNPFIYHVAEFVINIPGITTNTVISNGIILFGTNPSIPNVPEASALMLFGSGLVGLVLYRRRKRLE